MLTIFQAHINDIIKTSMLTHLPSTFTTSLERHDACTHVQFLGNLSIDSVITASVGQDTVTAHVCDTTDLDSDAYNGM